MVEPRKPSMMLFNFIFLVLMVVTSAYFISNTPTRSTQSFAYFETLGATLAQNPPVPIYPGAEIRKSYKKEERGLVGYETDLFTADPIFQVMPWYRQALAEDGWTETIAPEFPDVARSQSAEFQKGNLKLIVNIENEETGETEVMLEFPLQLP